MHSEGDPYVELHHLLAFAGARDVESLTRWLDMAAETSGSSAPPEILPLGWGLRSWANQDYRAAATLLDESVDLVSGLGGSRAQNQLFGSIADAASHCAELALAA